MHSGTQRVIEAIWLPSYGISHIHFSIMISQIIKKCGLFNEKFDQNLAWKIPKKGPMDMPAVDIQKHGEKAEMINVTYNLNSPYNIQGRMLFKFLLIKLVHQIGISPYVNE
jgi:hypothetical protein